MKEDQLADVLLGPAMSTAESGSTDGDGSDYDTEDDQSDDEPRPRGRGRVNVLLNALRGLGVVADPRDRIDKKRIPDIHKFNTPEVRRKVIAGLIDSDGYCDPIAASYNFKQAIDPHVQLFWDYTFLCRSTGSAARILPIPAEAYEVQAHHQLADRYGVGHIIFGGPHLGPPGNWR